MPKSRTQHGNFWPFVAIAVLVGVTAASLYALGQLHHHRHLAESPELIFEVRDEVQKQVAAGEHKMGTSGVKHELGFENTPIAAFHEKQASSMQDMEESGLTASWNELLGGTIQVDYMRERMASRRADWKQSLQSLEEFQDNPFSHQQHALVWPLAAYKHFGVKRVWSLGEYTQWADLCAALATLGIHVQLWPFEGMKYPGKSEFQRVDLIFTDYDGIHGAWRRTELPPPRKTWILDTFGTDGTIINHGFFGRQPPLTDYPLKRFLTLVPGYSERNRFLGTAVTDVHHRSPEKSTGVQRKTWRCILWSKVHPWFKDADYHCQLLKAYLEHCPVVATIDPYDQANSSELLLRCAPEVEIRPALSPLEFTALLQNSAVYIGVGEPLIAPSCFEALSLGVHVIQPRYETPKILQNKPISKGWTSQHPFLEQVPEPFAFSVQLGSSMTLEVSAAFRRIRTCFESAFDASASGPVAVKDECYNAQAFYDHGEYPLRETYSMDGFLKRVHEVVQGTTALEPSDWKWEREKGLAQLPTWVAKSAKQGGLERAC